MNYYIQGDAAKADKIKAAFKKLGCDVTGFDMCNDNILFFTYKLEGGGKVISTTNANLYTADIIKTHPDYKELELPVEPKFKVGDWIVRGRGFVYEPSLITEIRDYYICELLNGERVTYTLNDVHKNFHLWSIADAKDGDVLTDGKLIVIFNKLEEPTYKQHIIAYVGLDLCGRLQITEDTWQLGVDKAMPATKEQRELLFAKMKEVGYEWDEKKKELRKIKPHYDIANFYAGMPVLVRDYNNSQWSYVQFSHLIAERNVGEGGFKFNACGIPYIQCIPFEGNEHLLGTTDMPSEEYINW